MTYPLVISSWSHCLIFWKLALSSPLKSMKSLILNPVASIKLLVLTYLCFFVLLGFEFQNWFFLSFRQPRECRNLEVCLFTPVYISLVFLQQNQSRVLVTHCCFSLACCFSSFGIRVFFALKVMPGSSFLPVRAIISRNSVFWNRWLRLDLLFFKFNHQ